MIIGSLGVGWCTSTNLQSNLLAFLKALVHQAGLTLAGNISIEMVEALITGHFCERLRCFLLQKINRFEFASYAHSVEILKHSFKYRL